MYYKIIYIERGTEEQKSVKRRIRRKDSTIEWLNATSNLNARVFISAEKCGLLEVVGHTYIKEEDKE